MFLPFQEPTPSFKRAASQPHRKDPGNLRRHLLGTQRLRAHAPNPTILEAMVRSARSVKLSPTPHTAPTSASSLKEAYWLG